MKRIGGGLTSRRSWAERESPVAAKLVAGEQVAGLFEHELILGDRSLASRAEVS